MQRGASSKDGFFLEQLLAGLVSARASPELISLSQASGMFTKVQKHLLKAGGLPADTKPSLSVTLPPLVSLDTQQVSSLEMLAKIYAQVEGNDCLEAAAAVYHALATRVNGYSSNAVSLERRLELFGMALMQVACFDGHNANTVELLALQTICSRESLRDCVRFRACVHNTCIHTSTPVPCNQDE